jgi:hypothetical protein
VLWLPRNSAPAISLTFRLLFASCSILIQTCHYESAGDLTTSIRFYFLPETWPPTRGLFIELGYKWASQQILLCGLAQ